MKIETSLDWDSVSNELTTQFANLPYNPDLRKMFKNIETMVGQLSKLEVEARRTRHTSYSDEQKNKINKAIDHLEKLLLMAKLMS
jgi:hypothetical protein